VEDLVHTQQKLQSEQEFHQQIHEENVKLNQELYTLGHQHNTLQDELAQTRHKLKATSESRQEIHAAYEQLKSKLAVLKDLDITSMVSKPGHV
jgi:predicted nuclease with TOPRIM domain